MLNLRNEKSGFTLVEIMIVVAIIALLAAIAIPNVLRGRTTANETSSIGNLRALVSSLEMYRSVNAVYPLTATWVANMYPGGALPAFGPPSFNVAMTGQTIQGFNYAYLSAGPTYTITSTPTTLNQTGTRSFFVDASGQLRHCMTIVANALATVTDATIDNSPTNPC